MNFTIRNRVPYNKLLTNRASLGRTGEYWPSVVLVRTSLRSVRTVTTSGQYSPVRPSRSVSKRLLLCGVILRQNFLIWLNPRIFTPRQNRVSNFSRSCMGNRGRVKAVTSNRERTSRLSQSGPLFCTSVGAILLH